MFWSTLKPVEFHFIRPLSFCNIYMSNFLKHPVFIVNCELLKLKSSEIVTTFGSVVTKVTNFKLASE